MASVSKLTKSEAFEIRAIYTKALGGACSTTLAVRYGVSKSVICRILNGTHVHTQGMENIVRPRRGLRQQPYGRSTTK